MSEQKYLTDGRAVEVIQKLESGQFLVALIYGDEEDRYIDGEEVRIVDHVFDSPPTALMDKAFADVEAKVKELRTIKADLCAQIAEANRQQKEQSVKFKRYEKLRLLEDFIDGKVTHYVEISSWSGPSIIEFGEAHCQCGTYCRDLRLLSLFGKSNGDLEWRLSRYSDGSGSSSEVFPVTSLESAQEVARKYIIDKLELTKDEPESRPVEWAKKFGVPVPAEYQQAVTEILVTEKRKAIAEAQKKIEAAEKEIAEIIPAPQEAAQ